MSIEYLIIGAYLCLILGLSIFGFHRYIMVYLYRKYVHGDPPPPPPPSEWPTVTVQLPIYNENHVVARLLKAIACLDYPRDRLEIQVLDDSTDETTQTIAYWVEHYRRQGLTIHHIHRKERTGFKAGALAHGLRTARGEFIAILDADFVPPPDFLQRTIPYFQDPTVGLVQVRWEYLNRHFSILTRVQSVMLDGHFVVEHTARNRSGRFFNFNGTAGVWRRAAIESAGGWTQDTLTEDLDLSYRAQLKGWRFIYLKDYVVPSELPVETAAFMRQQFRWAKGSTQTALKLLPRILRSGVDPRVKLEAFFHLTANVSYVLIVGIGLLLGPVIWARYRLGLYHLLWLDVPLFCLATLSVATFYVLSQRENPTGLRGWWNWLWVIPMLMAVGIGISLNNARGVLEALLGVTSPFERTPKYGITHASAHPGWTLSAYRLKNWLMPLLGLGMGLYFLAVLYLCIEEDLWYSIPFVVLFMVGFLYTSGTTLWQTWVLPWTVRRLGVAPARHPLGM